jgi:hypothetical protein
MRMPIATWTGVCVPIQRRSFCPKSCYDWFLNDTSTMRVGDASTARSLGVSDMLDSWLRSPVKHLGDPSMVSDRRSLMSFPMN